MKLPKIPIDYSKAATGEAPFDGKEYFIFYSFGKIENGKLRTANGVKLTEETIAGILENPHMPTHYTPMPEFEEVKG